MPTTYPSHAGGLFKSLIRRASKYITVIHWSEFAISHLFAEIALLRQLIHVQLLRLDQLADIRVPIAKLILFSGSVSR